MSFSSVPFVFAFLPLSLLLYYICPRRLRMGVILLLSLVFYAWGDAKSLPVLGFVILFNYVSGLEIGAWASRGEDRRARSALWVSAGIDLLLLCWYKYLAGTMPVGISFFTFSALSYIIDIRRGRVPPERNILRAAVYMAFFPKLISGPIVRYGEFRSQTDDLSVSKEDAFAGGEQFLTGLFKKVLLADNLGRAFTAVHGLSSMSAGTAWLGMVFYSLQLYYDFGGYSDMAIGLARALGFRFGKNFDYPYRSLNISEFWRRWHISLGAWFREYVYIPLGGNRRGPGRQLLNLAVVWVLTGLWHGSTLNFLFWGLWHGFFVILERFVIRDRMDGVPRVLRVILTDLIAFVGWVFFFSPSLGGAFGYLGQMLGAGGMGLWDGAATFYLMNNLVLLAAAILFSGPGIRVIQENLVIRFGGGALAVTAAVYAVLLVFSVAGMVNATYSSFLYFQF